MTRTPTTDEWGIDAGWLDADDVEHEVGPATIEQLREVIGKPLPQAYFDRIRGAPGFFEPRGGWRGRTAAAGLAAETVPPFAAAAVVAGEVEMVVILGLFADTREPPVSAAEVQERLFGANPLGNLTDYYREVSGGRLTLRGTVLPWVRTRITRALMSP